MYESRDIFQYFGWKYRLNNNVQFLYKYNFNIRNLQIVFSYHKTIFEKKLSLQNTNDSL